MSSPNHLNNLNSRYFGEKSDEFAAGFVTPYLRKNGIEPLSCAYLASRKTVKCLERLRQAIHIQCEIEQTTMEQLQNKVTDTPPGKKKKRFFLRKVKKQSPLEKTYSLFLKEVMHHSNRQGMIDACFDGYFDLVKRFHANGISLDIVTAKSNASLLHYSIHKGTDALSLWLIGNKAPIHHKSSPNGRNPLHLACLFGRARVVAALVDAGASLEEPDTINGDTPLHLASSDHAGKARIQAARIAFFLLSSGSNPLKRNQAGKKANVYINNFNFQRGLTKFKDAESPRPNLLPHHLQLIPRDVRYLIFGLIGVKKYLSNMRLVCKEWNNTIVDDLAFPFKR